MTTKIYYVHHLALKVYWAQRQKSESQNASKYLGAGRIQLMILRSKLSLCIWHRELTLWFALLTATPIILHTLFLSRHWWTIEGKEDGNRLLTFPLLLFQIWPQYQLLKLLYNNEWAKEKLNYDKKIGSLGNFKIHSRYFHVDYVRKIESVDTFVITSFIAWCPLRGQLWF